MSEPTVQPRCASGNHAWLEQADADRCCNPAYRRESRFRGTFTWKVWVVVATGAEERATLPFNLS